MRRQFEMQLETLHSSMIRMGALCEDAIASAAKALLEDDDALREKTAGLEHEINLLERDLEQMCVRLLLHQQPMAGDLRRITAAQKVVTDMERIGDQAADIAELSKFMKGSRVKSDIHIADMARAAIKMVTDSIDSFVAGDISQAKEVVAYDDVVDGLFSKVKGELVERLVRDGSLAGDCLDLLMIAKYLERIGDHAENIAQWVLYAATGRRDADASEETK